MKPRKRPDQILVRVTSEEKETISKKAQLVGKEAATFLRDLGLSKEIKQPSMHRDDAKHLLYEIRKIGNNLNQVAHLCHKGYIDDCSEDINEFSKKIGEILNLIRFS